MSAGGARDETKCQRAVGEVERATKQTSGGKGVMGVKDDERTVIVRLCGQVRRHGGGVGGREGGREGA